MEFMNLGDKTERIELIAIIDEVEEMVPDDPECYFETRHAIIKNSKGRYYVARKDDCYEERTNALLEVEANWTPIYAIGLAYDIDDDKVFLPIYNGDIPKHEGHTVRPFKGEIDKELEYRLFYQFLRWQYGDFASDRRREQVKAHLEYALSELNDSLR